MIGLMGGEGKVTAGLAEGNDSLYRQVDGSNSPAGWLTVHRYQYRAQRSVTSMGEPYLLPFIRSVNGGESIHKLI